MPPPVPPRVKDGRMMQAGRHNPAPQASFFHAVNDLTALGAVEPDPVHRLAEQESVLGLVDRLGAGADHLDAELSSTPILWSARAQLSAVCPPMVGSTASGRSFSMILATIFRRDRLDVGCVGQVRIGHDRGRIGVHQDDPIALLPSAPCTPARRNSRTRTPAR
jgi:hypothetical protein